LELALPSLKNADERKFLANHGRSWGAEEKARLTQLYTIEKSIKVLAETLERSSESIRHQLMRLGLLQN